MSVELKVVSGIQRFNPKHKTLVNVTKFVPNDFSNLYIKCFGKKLPLERICNVSNRFSFYETFTNESADTRKGMQTKMNT